MDDPPVQTFYNLPQAGGGWSGPQSDNFAFQGPESSAQQETWTDLMRWDPSSQSPQSLPQSLNVEAPSGQVQPLYNRRSKTQMAQFSPSLSDQTYHGMPEHDASQPHFTFGGDPRGSNSFDFEFNALTSGPDMSGLTKPVNMMSQWTQQSPEESNGSSSISPSALKADPLPELSHPASSVSSGGSMGLSPGSLSEPQVTPPSSNSSPEPRLTNGRKRKSADVAAESEKPGRKSAKQQPVKKTAHNMIEKRYRTKLNDKIEELKNAVPSLKRMSTVGFEDENDEGDELDGLTPAHKTNKATVLSKATEYIRHLEKRNKQLNDDMKAMRAEMDKVKKMVQSAPMSFSNAASTPDGSRFPEDPFSSNTSPNTPSAHMPPQGMIPVPESMMNLHAAAAGQAPYGHYPTYATAPPGQAVQAQSRMVNVRGGQPFNKFMVGALAGLMILEGLGEREESGEKTEGRGLFAIPVHLLGRSSPGGMFGYSGSYGSRMTTLQLLKAFLLIGALVYLISPIFTAKPKSKKRAFQPIRLSPAPSLASPIEVRQNAWLTAIQTVWVPHHNFFYELAALALKTLKLSTRHLIGWRGYALLTGATREQEEARVSAWKIALDAQLMGGDAEISISRLVLTILASGTLPDTPARLMLKAMHIRVLLWEVAKSGYGTFYMFDELCAKLARRYWNEARAEHLLNVNSGSRSRVKVSTDPDQPIEPLPDHLAALLEVDCDDVLVDCIVQRAYNLAWNIPGGEHTEPDDSMDQVVEDFAISSPLDALAAWRSCYTLKKALTSSLNSTPLAVSPATVKDVELAVRIAPPASSAYIRALVAKAVLIENERTPNIFTALDALPFTTEHADVLENAVVTAPVAGDITLALTLAKCLALLRPEIEDAARIAESKVRAVIILNLPETSRGPWTLLSFAAAYKVLNAFAAEKEMLACGGAAHRGADTLAGTLRLWIGRGEGRRLGLAKSTRGKVVERCLALRKVLSGIRDGEERESGYGSAED